MATINAYTDYPGDGIVRVQWLTMGDADNGDAQTLSRFSDKTVTVSGTAASATTVIQGSNDGTNWFTLTDQNADAISFANTTGIALIAENPLYVRPSTSGGSGTDIDVIIVGSG